MLRLPVAVFAALAALASQMPAIAADDPRCSTDALLSLADTALADQPSVPRLAARRYGASAAFLKIRYGALTEEAASALVDSLLKANVRGADELGLAWNLHGTSDHQALPALAEDRPGTLTISLPISVIRALLLTKSGPDILLDRIAATPGEKRGGITQAITTAIIDQPDALKQAIALAAEKRAIPLLSDMIAAHLSAAQKDPAAWTAFLARRPADSNIEELTRAVSWVPAFVGNPRLKTGTETPEQEKTRTGIHETLIAASLEPEFDFLNTYLNQTGDIKSVATAAGVLKLAIDEGKIRRDGTLDTAWLIAYRALVETTGNRDLVHDTLGSITLQVGRYAWSGRVTVRDIIDHLLVVEALTPYVRAETQTRPEPPAALSDTMKAKYAGWLAMADIVRLGAVPSGLSNDPAQLGMLSELLFAKGDMAALAAFVDAAPPGEASVFTATDFAVRLDRHCASTLSHPAEAVLLAGQPIFKFDTKN